MSDISISKMNDKQLRNEVQSLRDELAVMKRKYEDIIYNLDTDNFSSRFVKEQGDMRTAIEVTAKGIKTMVSKEEMQSSIEQTASKIESRVDSLEDDNADLYTQITQTASKISSVVSKNLSAKFKHWTHPTGDNTTDVQKGMLCEYNDALYYYNDVTHSWKLYPYADGVKSQFVQTASGFSFSDDVYISGDAIVGGTISGAELANSKGTHRLAMEDSNGGVNDYGTFLLYNKDYGNVPYFSIYDNTLGAIWLRAAGEDFLKAHSSGGMNVTLYGNWDFSECDSINWGDFGTGGGGVAKFA